VRGAALAQRAGARAALEDDGEGEAVRARAGVEHGAVRRERVEREVRVGEAADHDVVEERAGASDAREGVRGLVHAARRDVGEDEGLGTGAGAGNGAGSPSLAVLWASAGRRLLGGGSGEVLGGAGGCGGGMGCAGGEEERRGHGWGRREARWGYFLCRVFAFAVYPIRERRGGKERVAGRNSHLQTGRMLLHCTCCISNGPAMANDLLRVHSSSCCRAVFMSTVEHIKITTDLFKKRKKFTTDNHDSTRFS